MERRARRRSRVVLALLSTLLAGCATTRMTSQVNPELMDRGFDKVLVQCSFQSLEHRQLAEEKLCEEISRTAGCQCLKSSDVFFPGEEHSAEQIASRVAELDIDGVLTLQPTGSGTSSTYVPQTTHTTGSAKVSGNTITGSSTTQTYGGYNISKPWAAWEAILRSTADGRVAWYATAASGGNAFAGWDDLIRSASTKTVAKLIADGVLHPRLPPAPPAAATPPAQITELPVASTDSTLTPICVVTPGALDFGTSPRHSTTMRSFEIRNSGGGVLSGVVALDSPLSGWDIMSGSGPYVLHVGERRTVRVRARTYTDLPSGCFVTLGCPQCVERVSCYSR